MFHIADLSGLLAKGLCQKRGDVHVTVSGNDNGSLDVDGDTGVGLVSCVGSLLDAVGHVAPVTVSLVGMTLGRVAVSGEMGNRRRKFTMLVKERDSIGPLTVGLEVLSDVNLMEGGFNILLHVTRIDIFGVIEVFHGLHEVTTDLLKVVRSKFALLVKSLEVVEALHGVIELVHNSLVVNNRVRMQVSHAVREVVDSRADHLGDGSHDVLEVCMLVNGMAVDGSMFKGSGVSLMVHGVAKRGLHVMVDGVAVLTVVGLRVVHDTSIA